MAAASAACLESRGAGMNAHWLNRAQAQAWWPEGWTPEGDTEPSPLLAALVLLGALLCSVPLLVFLGFGLGDVLLRSPAGYVVGALGLAAAVWWLRGTRHIFATCMALELWGLGLALVLLRWADDAGGSERAMWAACIFVSAALIVSAWMTAALWVVRLMGVVLAFALLATLMTSLNVAGMPDALVLAFSALALPLLALAWAWWCGHEVRWLGQPGAVRCAALADGFAVGLLLCALSVGTWWYLPMHLFGATLHDAESVRGWGSGWLLALPRWVAVPLVLGSGWVLMRRWSVAAQVRQGWQPLLYLTCAVLALAAWFSPAVGTVALVAAMAAASARWRLLAACALVVLALLSSFYYNVAWSLAAKGLGLALLGVAMALVLLVLRARRSSAAAPTLTRARYGAAWVLLGGVIALGAANADIWGKETVIAKGERILVPLAPVDPRSLMQGDYMQLRFSIPLPMQDQLEKSGAYQLSKRAVAVARLNERNEAELLHLAQPGETVGAGEILLPLKELKGQWVLVTDAYFFAEGEGGRFEKARFGEFRVLPDGRALLVGLADEHGRVIPAHAGHSQDTEATLADEE